MSTFLSAAKRMGLWYGLIAAATLLLVPVVASATTIGNSITVTNDATITGNVTTTNVTSSGYIEAGKMASFNASYTNGDLNVGNQLVIDGAVYASSTLEVSGVSIFWNTVRSSGNDQQALGAYGNAWANFFVSGTSFIDGVSSTSGLYPTANNSYDIGDFTRSWNDIFASGTVRLGDITNQAQGSAAGDLSVGNELAVDGAVKVSSTFQATGASRLYSTLIVDTSVSSTIVTSSRHLGVGSIASLSQRWTNGDVNIGGQILVDGNAFVSSALRVTGLVTAYDAVTTTMVTSSRHLGVGSPASLSARWTNGDANFGGQILVDGSALVSSTLQVTSLATLYSGFISNASSSVASLTVSGNLNASSTVYIGGNILPGTNNSRDLGGAGAAMRDLFVSSSLTIGTASTTASSTAIVGVLSILTGGIDFPDVASTGMKCTDTSNIGAGGSDTTVTGTLIGDYVTVAPTVWDSAFSSGTLQAFVPEMNKIRIVYCGSSHDVTSQDRDPVTQRYRVSVWKF